MIEFMKKKINVKETPTLKYLRANLKEDIRTKPPGEDILVWLARWRSTKHHRRGLSSTRKFVSKHDQYPG